MNLKALGLSPDAPFGFVQFFLRFCRNPFGLDQIKYPRNACRERIVDMKTQGNEFIVVASFDSAPEAWVYRNRLADEGLNAFLLHEYIANTHWFYAHAMGGVKVQIPRSQLKVFQGMEFGPVEIPPEAIGYSKFSNDESLLSRCPRCSSIEVFVTKWPKKIIFLLWLLIGVPIPIYAPQLSCESCGLKEGIIPESLLNLSRIYVVLALTWMTFAILVSNYYGFDWLRLLSIPGTP